MCLNFESLLSVLLCLFCLIVNKILKFIDVIVICYCGKLGNNKSSIFRTRDNFLEPRQFTRDPRHSPIRLSPRRITRHLILVILILIININIRSFFRLNLLREIRKRCSRSIFSSQAIILDFFDRNVSSCYVRVFRLP